RHAQPTRILVDDDTSEDQKNQGNRDGSHSAVEFVTIQIFFAEQGLHVEDEGCYYQQKGDKSDARAQIVRRVRVGIVQVWFKRTEVWFDIQDEQTEKHEQRNAKRDTDEASLVVFCHREKVFEVGLFCYTCICFETFSCPRNTSPQEWSTIHQMI